MLELEFGEATHPGKVREGNEDRTGRYVPRSRLESGARGWLFVLADGVGGLDRGEVAAAKAVDVLVSGFAAAPENTSLLSLLPRLIQHANAAIHDDTLAAEHRGRLMASTVVACALRLDRACIAHAGDSRCYLVRRARAACITQDHTIAAEQFREGLITAEEAAESEARHILTRSLGPERYVAADTTALNLQRGDVLVLCSDGLCLGLDDRRIAGIAAQPLDPAALADELVRAALDADGSDNITAQVIAVRSVEATSIYRGRLGFRRGT